MSSKKKFYKTTITVEILSEENYAYGYNLEKVNYDITQGECSGKVTETGRSELTAEEAAKALIEQGSSPAFFQLDENGSDLED